MENFNFYNPARVVFGENALEQIGSLLKAQRPKTLLMIYKGSYVKTLGIRDAVIKACEENNIRFFESAEVVPNPRIELVRKLVDFVKENEVDFILAAGGGSAIDTAKAVSMGSHYDGDVWDFFTGKAEELGKVIPIGVVSTIPASGSETSTATIISDADFKLGYESEKLIPKFAILNPTFTLGLPDYQTACGIADMFSHMLERYFSPSEHTDTTDFLIEGAIKALILNAKRLRKDPKDLNARAEIQLLGTVAHNGMLDMGRISCWGSHRIEHEISALYDATHGEGMAIVLIAFTKYMAVHKPERLMQLANRVYGYDYHDYSDTELAMKVSEELERFFKYMGLKTTLTELDVKESDFEEMANKATKGGKIEVGHYMPLDEEKIIEILKLAM